MLWVEPKVKEPVYLAYEVPRNEDRNKFDIFLEPLLFTLVGRE